MDYGSPNGRTWSSQVRVSLLSAASQVLSALRRENVEGCIVGGLAVSARCDPRFTLGRQLDAELLTLRDQTA